MDEFSEDMKVQNAWDLLRKSQYLSDLDWDVEFPESPERDTQHKTSAIGKKKEKTIAPHEGCSSHNLQPEISDHLAQKEASNVDETDTARHSASIMESRVSIHQANILVEDETDYREIKEEPRTPPSSDISYERPVKSETLHEDIKGPALNEMRNDKPETSCAGCCSHSLQPDIVEPLMQRKTSTSDETDTRRSSASEVESRVSINRTIIVVKEEPDCIEVKEEPLSPLASSISCEDAVKNETHDGDIQANILVEDETDYREIKEEPRTPPSSDISYERPVKSETLHEDIKGPALNEMRNDKPETSYAGCCSHSLQPDIVEPLMQRKTSTSDETDTRRSSASEVESRVSIHQTNIVVKEEPDCIEVKEEPLSPLASSISCEEPVENETNDGDIQVSSVSPMKKKLEITSFASFHCDASRELSPGTESGSVIAETPRPIMAQMDSSKKGNRGTYIEYSTACSLQIASSSSQPLLAEAVGMSTQEHSSVLLQNVDCQTPFAMASCSTAIGGYLLKRHFEEKVAEERQARRRAGSRRERERTRNSGRRCERGLSTEISLPQREMEKAPSLKSLCEESVREINGKTFECSTCKKHFPSKIVLDKHTQRHSGAKCYMCSHCEKSFCQRDHLTRHMRIHSGEKPYKCNQCKKSFSHRSSLIQHMHIHSGEKPFKCSQCEKSFNNSGTLTKHMSIHTGKKPFKCSQCEKSFRLRGHLIIHMRIHSGKKPFKCSECEKSFNNRGTLTKHMHIHTGKKPFKCSQCEKSFSSRSNLTVHMRIHSREKPFKCSQCEKSFNNRGTLTKHMHIHTGKKPFKCSQCEKSFSCRSNLTVHMRIHSGMKPFKCSECEKSFNNRGTLTKHMHIHTGKKPFKCSQCEKSFSSRSNLTVHMRIHSGEKPFKCSQCEKSFHRRAHLNQHMRIHTGVKPFKCSHCDQSFSSRSNLTRHMRIHK